MQPTPKVLAARVQRLAPPLRRMFRSRGPRPDTRSSASSQVLPYLADFKRPWRLADQRTGPRRRFWRHRR